MKKRHSRPRFKIPQSSINIVLLVVLLSLVWVYKTYAPWETKEIRQLPSEIKKELLVAPPTTTFRVPVLLYHYVEYVKDDKDTIRKSLNITPNIFEEQVKTLQKDGFTFLTTSELADVLDGKKVFPRKPVILTFDDGYRDVYTDVLPILQKYNIKATAFIVPGFIDGPNSMYLWQLKEVAASGLVEVGAHTMHHLYLTSISHQNAGYEIRQSKQWLEETIKKPVVSFAYPYGAFDKQTIELVKEAGFKVAVSTVPGIEVNQADRFFVYRIRPGSRTGDVLLKYLEQTSFKDW